MAPVLTPAEEAPRLRASDEIAARIRAELAARGIVLQDGAGGTTWVRA